MAALALHVAANMFAFVIQVCAGPSVTLMVAGRGGSIGVVDGTTALPFVEIDDREICRQRASAVGSARMPDRKQPVERALPMGHENCILVDAISGEWSSRSHEAATELNG